MLENSSIREDPEMTTKQMHWNFLSSLFFLFDNYFINYNELFRSTDQAKICCQLAFNIINFGSALFDVETVLSLKSAMRQYLYVDL